MYLTISFLYSEVIASWPSEGEAPDKLHLPLVPAHLALWHRSITEHVLGGAFLILVGEEAASSLPEVVDQFCIL